MYKATLTVIELANALGISRGAAYKLVRTASFPSIRIGGRWITPIRQLENWLEEESTYRASCVYGNARGKMEV